MSLFAVLGALLGGGLTTAFIFYTKLDYPLVTGGMPLTSGWATGVVTFEFTMGGAVVGRFLRFYGKVDWSVFGSESLPRDRQATRSRSASTALTTLSAG